MQTSNQQSTDDDVTLKEILDILKRNSRLIMLFSIVGLLIATSYVVLTPKRYEAILQVQMAELVSTNTNTNTNTNINAEDPAALIERLRLPTTYPKMVLKSCGVSYDDIERRDYFGGALEIKPIKNATNVVEMKVRASNPDLAKQCAVSIMDMIVEQQRALIRERLAGRKEQLALYQNTLQTELKQLEAINIKNIVNIAYLARLDKMTSLRSHIDTLQEEDLLSQMHPAKLVAPVFVPDKPISPKVSLALTLGLSLGLMLGVLYTLGREGWRKAA
jgi:uncharacterized protein involved in exopolysaccharide biosynthesis